MRKRFINVFLICCMLAVLSIPAVLEANDTKALRRAGEKISNTLDNKEASAILFSEGDIEITKEELALVMTGNMGQGKNPEEIIENAVRTIVTQKYLYAQASKAGFEVTDAEFETYKMLLEESIKNAENKEDVLAYFDGFGGEDHYWEKMKPTIKRNLCIRKYLNSQIGNKNDITAYSEKESPEEIEHQQKLESTIKEDAYANALTDEGEEKLTDIATQLYQEIK